MADRSEVIKHDNMTVEQMMEQLPNILFSKLKGRILNAVETFLDKNDPRFASLKNEICLHLADGSLTIARSMNRIAKEKRMKVDLASYITRGEMGPGGFQKSVRPR